MVGVRWNIEGAAIALAAAHVLAVPYVSWSVRQFLGLAPRQWMRLALPIYAGALAFFALCAMTPRDRPLLLPLLCTVVVGPALTALLWWGRPRSLLTKDG
jgi:hypothetical protein